jgi:hypothetical protein
MRWLGLCFIFLVSASIRAEFNSFEEYFNSNTKITPLSPTDADRLEEYYLEFVKSTDKDQQASLGTKISLFKSEKLEIYYAKKLENHFKDQTLTEDALRSLGLLARVTASTDFALDFLLRIYLETKADVSKSISKFKAEEVGMALSRYPHQTLPNARFLSLFLTYRNNIPKPLVWDRLANGNSQSLRIYNEFSNSVATRLSERCVNQRFPRPSPRTCARSRVTGEWSVARFLQQFSFQTQARRLLA